MNVLRNIPTSHQAERGSSIKLEERRSVLFGSRQRSRRIHSDCPRFENRHHNYCMRCSFDTDTHRTIGMSSNVNPSASQDYMGVEAPLYRISPHPTSTDRSRRPSRPSVPLLLFSEGVTSLGSFCSQRHTVELRSSPVQIDMTTPGDRWF